VALAVAAAVAVLAGLPRPPAAVALASRAATLALSGYDATTASRADSATAMTGVTRPGDTIRWVLSYTNNTGAAASVTETDLLTGHQSLVRGSLVTPPGLSGRWSTNGGATYRATEPAAGVNAIGAVGMVAPAPGLATSSAQFSLSTMNFTTPGGDGYTVEGLDGNIYTAFHHNHTATAVYCATLTGSVCPGWPALSTYVNPVSGTPIGTGGIGPYTTGYASGSFIVAGKLYWPVEDTVAAGGSYAVGIQCLNLSTLDSCGFTRLGTEAYKPHGDQGLVVGDGIAAADGNYYFFDDAGDMLCFSVTSGACGSAHVSGAQVPGSGGVTLPGSIMTVGQHVWVTFNGAGRPGSAYITCYDTATSAACPGFPKRDGAAIRHSGYTNFLAPVLSDTGTVLGACDVREPGCYTAAGAVLANPYDGITGFGYQPSAPVGLGSGAIVGARFYAGDLATGAIDCFDFASRTGTGPVPKCAGFTGQPDLMNYTVRALASLPGCLAANGDGRQILLFNSRTGGACVSATTAVPLTSPSAYYCDGKPGHARHWGVLTLNGLAGTEFTAATVTLTGPGGPVTGFTSIQLAPGQTSLDLSSLPVSGSTATLTAQVTLTGVTGTVAVTTASATLSWTGDPMQTCFETTVPGTCPAAGAMVASTGNVVTTGVNRATDAPGGTSSGTATFDVAATGTRCTHHVPRKHHDKRKTTPPGPVTIPVTG
jgi:hypothetical protein